jgi:protein-S-isoprenylcysteine O-methyltransferase Ste14
MRGYAAAVASACHFVAAPGVVVGFLPWLLTGWVSGSPLWPLAVRVVGACLLAVGTSVVSAEFVRFVREGGGSPAPIVPTRSLVTGGMYRYVRNPMYVAVVAAIVGQGLLLSRPILIGYAAAVWLVVAAFVRWYEEPTLARTFGVQYDRYREAVPRWLPRISSSPQRRTKTR